MKIDYEIINHFARLFFHLTYDRSVIMVLVKEKLGQIMGGSLLERS